MKPRAHYAVFSLQFYFVEITQDNELLLILLLTGAAQDFKWSSSLFKTKAVPFISKGFVAPLKGLASLRYYSTLSVGEFCKGLNSLACMPHPNLITNLSSLHGILTPLYHILYFFMWKCWKKLYRKGLVPQCILYSIKYTKMNRTCILSMYSLPA